jgi:hypothetical protein
LRAVRGTARPFHFVASRNEHSIGEADDFAATNVVDRYARALGFGRIDG